MAHELHLVIVFEGLQSGVTLITGCLKDGQPLASHGLTWVHQLLLALLPCVLVKEPSIGLGQISSH